MKQPGRTSAADLSVVRITAADRPKPPDHMTDEQKVLWESITATKPADWFTDDTLPLLEAYCEAWLAHRQASLALRSESVGSAEYAAVYRVQKDSANTLAQMATKMRLSQSSRYGARGASGAHERTLKASKPWEM